MKQSWNSIAKHLLRLSRQHGVAGCMFTLIAFAALGTGCASPEYLLNRKRDAADVFTLSVGAGLGAKARIGPVGTGLLLDSPLRGLRGGTWLTSRNFVNPGKPIPVNNDVQLLLVGEETFLGTPLTQARGKAFTSGMVLGLNIPASSDIGKAAAAADRMARQRPPRSVRHSPWHYLSQVEVVAGLGLSLRVGFNPVELIDLVLGFTGLDLFGDDIEGAVQPPSSPATEPGTATSRREESRATETVTQTRSAPTGLP